MDDQGANGSLISHIATIVATAGSTIVATLKFSGKQRHNELIEAVRDIGRAIEHDGNETRQAIHQEGELQRALLKNLEQDQKILMDRIQRN